jgi:threonine 3-dehydrogenase
VKPDQMLALVYDKSTMPWDKTTGFVRQVVERPVLGPDDDDQVIVKVIYAGFCGSDRGIWNRTAFKGMIFDSLKRQQATTRIIGHEMIGEIVEVGTLASRRYGYRPKDVVSTESHIICNVCYQCRIGQTHICADDVIIGIGRDGCFAEYIKLPAQTLWPTDRRKIDLRVGRCRSPSATPCTPAAPPTCAARPWPSSAAAPSASSRSWWRGPWAPRG